MAADLALSKAQQVRAGQLLAGSPSNWGRWGPDDEVGSLNFLTNAEVLRGVRAVKQGKVFMCGERIGAPGGDPIWPGREQSARSNVRDKGDYDKGTVTAFPGGVEFADDKISMFLEGSTQFDALGHVWYDDKVWNGFPASATVGSMQKASVLPIAERGITGRGVLLDMAAYKGKFALDKLDLLHLPDLLDAAKKQGVTIRSTTCVCASASCNCCTRRDRRNSTRISSSLA